MASMRGEVVGHCGLNIVQKRICSQCQALGTKPAGNNLAGGQIVMSVDTEILRDCLGIPEGEGRGAPTASH